MFIRQVMLLSYIILYMFYRYFDIMFMMNSHIRTLCLNFGDSMNLRLLFISHSLDNSGAPIVLFEIIKLCKRKGHIVDVISLDDGILHSSLEKENIHVDIADDFLDNLKKWQNIFYKYDAVIVNTLVCIEAIYALSTTTIPTVWWIHEHEPWFIHYKPIFPKPYELHSNIHVWGVSPITCKLIEQYCNYMPTLFPFGIEDALPLFSTRDVKNNDNRVVFVVPGKFSTVKGQDILLNSISMLSSELSEKCSFNIFGCIVSEEQNYFQEINSLSANLTNVNIQLQLDHDETLKKIYEADYLIVPSRFEPFPTTAVEAMMLNTVPVVSDVCGVSYYINNYCNSFIFASESPKDLYYSLCKAIDFRLNSKSEYEIMQKKFRKCYEDNFKINVVANKFFSLIRNYMTS